MRELGYAEGESVVIHWRYANGLFSRAVELASDLVGVKVNVIAAHHTPRERAPAVQLMKRSVAEKGAHIDHELGVPMPPKKTRRALNWMMLALESNRVIGLRLAKLMRGGKGAQREAERMISEKIQAAAKAGASLMAGASSDEIVRQYRKRVKANAKRLGRQPRRRKRKSS